jgi:hypothetical protein
MRKAEIPQTSEKGLILGADPLTINKPTDSKAVDAAKAIAIFTGWTYAAVHTRNAPNRVSRTSDTGY